MELSVIFTFAAIIIIGALMLVLFSARKAPRKLNIEQYRVRWLAIEQKVDRNELSSYHLAVLNADKLVDQALRDRGSKGQTMGERLKSTESVFSDLNGLWSAHKLRNRIAHETDVNVTYDEAHHALCSFKRALKDLGAI
jgi:hypothetical protein